MTEPIKVTRKELYVAVWSTSLTQVAKEYGVSDVAIRKRCIRNNIPLPPKDRKNAKRPPLPGDPTIEMLIVPNLYRGQQPLRHRPAAPCLDERDLVVTFRPAPRIQSITGICVMRLRRLKSCGPTPRNLESRCEMPRLEDS